MKRFLTCLFAVGVLGVMGSLATAGASEKSEVRIEKEARHELRTLPYYGVFDNLTYQVKGDRVVLAGQVTQPTLKTAAEKAVKSIEGVDKVDNTIEVLPLSDQDDRIRLAAYQSIYAHPALSRYGLNAVLPIHIIVKNGDVELIGFVSTELDRNLAGAQVNSVAGVHSVKNSIVVSKG